MAAGSKPLYSLGRQPPIQSDPVPPLQEVHQKVNEHDHHDTRYQDVGYAVLCCSLFYSPYEALAKSGACAYTTAAPLYTC
jgi:hypothetical protein